MLGDIVQSGNQEQETDYAQLAESFIGTCQSRKDYQEHSRSPQKAALLLDLIRGSKMKSEIEKDSTLSWPIIYTLFKRWKNLGLLKQRSEKGKKQWQSHYELTPLGVGLCLYLQRSDFGPPWLRELIEQKR